MIGASKKQWSAQGDEKPTHRRHPAGKKCGLALAALPHDAVLAFKRPRIQSEWRMCNPIASVPGSAQAKKFTAARLHLGLICNSRSGTYRQALDYSDGGGAAPNATCMP